MLQGNAGGYLVRQMILVGIGGEHPECQTPTLVDRDPYTRLCQPTLKDNSHPTSVCNEDLENLPPLLFYSKLVKR